MDKNAAKPGNFIFNVWRKWCWPFKRIYLKGSIRKNLIAELSKQKLLDKSLKNEIVLSEILSKKVIGFFFDASWCMPGKSFTQEQLIKIYGDAKKEDLNFEIVFVSLDFDTAYVHDMYLKDHSDWLLWPNDKTITK